VAGQLGGPHQPLDSLAADPDPFLAQIEVDAARAVAFAAARVDLADPDTQLCVGERPLGPRPSLPRVEAGAGDAEDPAEQRDRVVGLLRRDEPEAAHRVSLSRAKKAAAFFKISRSCSSVRTLRRNSRSSTRSSLDNPAACRRRPPTA